MVAFGFNAIMTESEIRCAVLRNLIDKSFNNTQLRFANRVEKPARQIADMLAIPPRKSFGHKIAREFEKKLELDPYFFENIANAGAENIPSENSGTNVAKQTTASYTIKLSADEQLIIDGYRAASNERRQIMMSIATAAQEAAGSVKKSKRHTDETASLFDSIGITSRTTGKASNQ